MLMQLSLTAVMDGRGGLNQSCSSANIDFFIYYIPFNAINIKAKEPVNQKDEGQ